MVHQLILAFCLFGVALSAVSVGNCGASNKMSIGPCVSGVAGPCGQGNAAVPGYACDPTLTQCCPTVNTQSTQYQTGPAVGGMCPVGYTAVYGIRPDGAVCVSINSTGPASTGTPLCVDSSTSCPTWVKNDFCTSVWYTVTEKRKNCAKSCNLC